MYALIFVIDLLTHMIIINKFFYIALYTTTKIILKMLYTRKKPHKDI